MNKKGFTLVELIVVITLIAIVAVIATPNVINMVDNGRKEQILADAENFLSDVKYKSKLLKYKDFFPVEGTCKEICANNSSFANDLDKDPDGNSYDKNNSCVRVCLVSGNTTYEIKLLSVDGSGASVRGISSNEESVEYVLEENLNKDSVIKFK